MSVRTTKCFLEPRTLLSGGQSVPVGFTSCYNPITGKPTTSGFVVTESVYIYYCILESRLVNQTKLKMNKSNKVPTLKEVQEYVRKMQDSRVASKDRLSKMPAKAVRTLLAEIMPSK